jgi:hypothetical protein
MMFRMVRAQREKRMSDAILTVMQEKLNKLKPTGLGKITVPAMQD